MTTAMHGLTGAVPESTSQESVIDLTRPVQPPVFTPTAELDAAALASMAAEVAASVARHRQELAAAMAELTALQRTLRSEVRTVIAELDRIAAGVAPDAAVQTSESVQVPVADDDIPRRSIGSRLRRAR